MAPQKVDLKEEVSLTAVLIIETFNNNFQPLTNYEPLALIPLVNSPLMDYSLDWLQRNRIHETIIYCCTHPHSEKIRQHCRQWSLKFGNIMKLNVICSENCSSVGDAMRDLYSKALLKSDFILLNGLVVANLDINLLHRNYKSASAKDPNCVMSCVYLKRREREKFDRTRIVDVVVNSHTGKLLSHSRSSEIAKIVLPTEIIQQGAKLKVLRQLDDTGVFVCSPMIPALFSDNFDYGTIDSMTQGLIEQEELLGCSIHTQLADIGSAAVVSSFVSYAEVSQDVIRRQSFPSVPEKSLSSQRTRYAFESFVGNYWDASAKFHKKSVTGNVALDAGTVANPRSRIRNSVLGQHCVVRENVNINGAFILNNVTISKGCILDLCFLADGVKLLPGVHLEPGVVLGPDVVLGPNLKVDRCTKLVKDPCDPSDEFDHLVCGNEGRAFRFLGEEGGPEVGPEWGSLGIEKNEDGSSDIESVDSDEDELDGCMGMDGSADLSSDEEREQEFGREVMDSLLNGYKSNSKIENVILELNSSRHAYNVSMENVLLTVTKCVLRVIEESEQTRLTDEKLWQSMKKGLECFADLIKNYIKKVKDQIVVLRAIEEIIDEDNRFASTAQRVLYEMNQELEIIDDEVIIFWYSKGGAQTEAFPLIAKSISKFVAWLKQNQEEEEESSEGDEE